MSNKFCCSSCGFDHATQPDEAYSEHANLIANKVAYKLIGFAKICTVSKIEKYPVLDSIYNEIRLQQATINPEFVFTKVKILMDESLIKVLE